jgi:hypothetical protein
MKQKHDTVNHDAHELRLIRKDFIFVITLNLILLAAMLGLYFWNRSSGQLDQFFSSIIKF